MKWVLLLLVVLVAVVLWTRNRQRAEHQRQVQEQQLQRLTAVAEEDVTRFGEELTGLHVDTMTAELDTAGTQDYQRALDSYEHAKALLADVRNPDDVSPVTRTLEDGRYALACVRARVAGEALPQRRPPCFFNPAHGPAQTDVSWAPAGGEPREIPVCLADADRLAQGAEPDTRQVRRGNQMVPWYAGGPGYAPYAGGYYGGWSANGLFAGVLLGSLLSGGGGYDAGFADGVDAGDGGDLGGGDGGGDFGGGDFGGGDFGGGDFGGDFGGF